jgi:hypothetical protein
MTDMVHNPAHYTGGHIQCIDAIESCLSPTEYLGYLRGNIMKYTWRFRQKVTHPTAVEGKQDLEKAQWYMVRLMEFNIKYQAWIEKHNLQAEIDQLNAMAAIWEQQDEG